MNGYNNAILKRPCKQLLFYVESLLMETGIKEKIAENLKRIKGNIAEACLRTKRDPMGVRLIAVTKTVDIDIIRALLEIEQLDTAESRVQELIQHYTMIRESVSRRLVLPNTTTEQKPGT